VDLIALAKNPVPSGATTGYFNCPGKIKLRFARWQATRGPERGTVCLFQGRGEFIEKYFEVVADLRRRGFGVATMDWRGQGGSSRMLSNPNKGFVRSFADFDQDLAYFMKEVVLPTMSKEFASVDPKYAEMNCKTCHGKGAEDKTFKMPNPDLPHLPTTQEGFAKIKQEKPKVLQFMVTVVKPKMAALLKEPEMDPATKTGEFGCQKCHVFGEGTAKTP